MKCPDNVAGSGFAFLAVIAWRILVGLEEAAHPFAIRTHHHIAHPVDIVAARGRVSRIQEAAVAWTDRWPIQPLKDVALAVLTWIRSLMTRGAPILPTHTEQ